MINEIVEEMVSITVVEDSKMEVISLPSPPSSNLP